MSETSEHEAVNAVLKKHGWLLHRMQMEANGTVAKYTIVRTEDGLEAVYKRTLADIVNSPIDQLFEGTNMPVSFTLLICLVDLAKRMNAEHPA